MHLQCSPTSAGRTMLRGLRAVAIACSVFGLPLALQAATVIDTGQSITTEIAPYVALSAAPQYQASGYVTAAVPGGFDLGSGTLIAPDWVLTAAHVVTQQTTVGNQTVTTIDAPASVSFGQGAQRSPALVGADAVTQVIVMPGWNFNIEAGNDLALLKLATPVTGVTPATLYPTSLPVPVGQTATAVGYGTTGTGLTGNTAANSYDATTPSNSTGFYERMGVNNVIDAAGPALTSGPTPGNPSATTYYSFAGLASDYLLTDFDRPGVSSASLMGDTTPLTYEGASTPGDSGGGLFVAVGGKTYLAGVTDFVGGFGNNATSTSSTVFGYYGDYDGYTFVGASNTAAFIDSVVAPEPSTFVLAGLGAAGLLWQARRRLRGPKRATFR
ncbi:MAG TPA: trypsin-like serine protease [Pirellulales bacterium]|nr:trypsin-like serine protease [Pirellulales bacterium]